MGTRATVVVVPIVAIAVSSTVIAPGAVNVVASTADENVIVMSLVVEKPSSAFTDATFGVTDSTGAFTVPSTLPFSSRSVGYGSTPCAGWNCARNVAGGVVVVAPLPDDVLVGVGSFEPLEPPEQPASNTARVMAVAAWRVLMMGALRVSSVSGRARMIALLDGAQGYAVPSNSGKDRRPARNGAKPLTAAQDKAASATSRVRIIAGQWRSRRIRFAAAPEVRPTPDRIRETLFNWLQTEVPGARCLDLFAGSGALGLEAASRGAREVTLVERDRRVVQSLETTVAELGATGVRVVEADAFAYLNGPVPPAPYDLVFLDPPFAKGWLVELCTLLENRGWLAPHASIYLECSAGDGEPALPAGWALRRSARAGEVGAHLARRRSEPSSPSIEHSGIEPSGIEQR